jgi:ubiquinone/menaquinone biosynthesis C-methylase UbiE
MGLRTAIIAQFKQPHGAVGHLAGWILAQRGSNRARNRWTVDLLDLKPHHRVLEIGCGPGVALTACAAKLTTGRAVGLDHSAVMIAQAGKRLAGTIAEGKAQLVQGGLEQLAALPGPFDRIFSINVIQFVGDIGTAIDAMTRVLAEGGLLAVTFQARVGRDKAEAAHEMADRLARAMSEAGLADIRVEELPLGSAPAICVRGTKKAG